MPITTEPDEQHILIVEDSRAIRGELGRAIRHQVGMTTHMCKTYAEAESFLSEFADSIFLAILDLHLPDCEEGAIVDLFCDAGVPSIVFTANVDENVREKMLSKDIIDYVVKDANAVINIIDYIQHLRQNQYMQILVVDDSISFRTAMVEMLRKLMFQVLEVEDAEAGLEVVKENPDIVLAIVDFALPGMNGVELTRKIRALHPKNQLAIIGISSFDSPLLTVRFIKNGANDFLSKPFEKEEFVTRVTHSVDMITSMKSLQDANLMKNRILGMVSHDLRNPINGIKGFVEMLLSGSYGELTSEQSEALEFIRNASNQMREMVINLLDLAVINAGELRLNMEQTNLCELVTMRLNIHSIEAKRKNITLEGECSDLGTFSFDPSRIGQVVDNLLSNAVKFTPVNGTVAVKLDRVGDMARVCVRDSGLGVPPGEEELLFQSFKTTSVRPTAGESSTGLGLPIVKTIVEAHGGEVWVESDFEQGASFFFTLPMDEGA